jgi:hypothetical protein
VSILLADIDTDTNTDSIDNSIDTSGMDVKPGKDSCVDLIYPMPHSK